MVHIWAKNCAHRNHEFENLFFYYDIAVWTEENTVKRMNIATTSLSRQWIYREPESEP